MIQHRETQHYDDAHYHHLLDGIIAGGLMKCTEGRIKVPDQPGLGVQLDHERVEKYTDLFKRLGGYPYDRDLSHPGWYSLVPNTGWANPEK